jgi:hypothetical protein
MLNRVFRAWPTFKQSAGYSGAKSLRFEESAFVVREDSGFFRCAFQERRQRLQGLLFLGFCNKIQDSVFGQLSGALDLP